MDATTTKLSCSEVKYFSYIKELLGMCEPNPKPIVAHNISNGMYHAELNAADLYDADKDLNSIINGRGAQ